MAGLTRERIIETAIRMADRDGFEAVTMRRIATELGVHVTSLYNHVATREAVTDGIIETLIGEAKLPAEPIGWEAWVRSFFAAIGTMAVTHPGAFTALQYRPVQGAQAATAFEVALSAFADAGFGPEDAYSSVKAASMMALSVGLEKRMLSQAPMAETAVDELPPDQFPQVWLVRELADPEAAWSFSLETLIAGLRAQLRRSKTRA